MIRIAGVVVARDEATRLSACLASLRGVDELLVADHGSTDETARVARAAGARVVAVEGTLGAAREAARRAATTPWIIMIDADERLPPDAVAQIRTAIASAHPAVAAFRLPIRTWLGARFLRFGGFYPARRVRVLRRADVRWRPADPVHEVAQIDGRIARLALPIEHYSFADLAAVEVKWRRYAELAGAHAADAHPGAVATAVRAGWRWIRMYLLRGGLLMGRDGLALANLSAASVVWRWRAARRTRRHLKTWFARDPRDLRN